MGKSHLKSKYNPDPMKIFRLYNYVDKVTVTILDLQSE